MFTDTVKFNKILSI